MLGRAPSEEGRAFGLPVYLFAKNFFWALRARCQPMSSLVRGAKSHKLLCTCTVPALQLAMVLPTMTTSVAPQVTRARAQMHRGLPPAPMQMHCRGGCELISPLENTGTAYSHPWKIPLETLIIFNSQLT